MNYLYFTSNSVRTLRRFAGRVTGLCLLITGPWLQAERDDQPQHAPPEAWLPGESLPFFGSENPWNRRFFSEDHKRVGQPQFLALIDGRVSEAIALCEKRLAADAVDLESHLILAMALGIQSRLDAADQSLEKALALGLPPGRLLADRSPYMATLHATPTWQRVAQDSSPLLHGPMLGAMTPHGLRIWVRTLQEAVFEVRVSAKGDFARPDAVARGRTLATADFTGTVAIDGLRPATRYTYEVTIDGQTVPRGETWEFRTFPEEDTPESVRIAFGGCAQYFPPNERIWDTIRLRRPEAFLILGDNVYIDLPETVGPFHNYTYHRRQSRPEFRRLAATLPTFAIWDDHDAGIDDLFLGPHPDKPGWKVEHLRLFERNWNNPSYGAPPAWPGVWHSFRVGPVECFLLDGRYYRENFLSDNPSMLGPVQKAWLFDALKTSTAPFKLLVSPVAWADDAKLETTPDGELIRARDTWAGFREEREQIFDFLASERISGVLLLSSDRHRHDVRRHDRPSGYPLWEFESGWLTNQRGSGGSGTPVFEYLEGPAFGLITASGQGPEPSARIELITNNGEPVYRHELKLSELRDD